MIVKPSGFHAPRKTSASQDGLFEPIDRIACYTRKKRLARIDQEITADRSR